MTSPGTMISSGVDSVEGVVLTIVLVEDVGHLVDVLAGHMGQVPHLLNCRGPSSNIGPAAICAEREKTTEDALSHDVKPSEKCAKGA